MSATEQQSGPIAVYGATGYTGRLVAAELARQGAEFVISGRNRAKLDALAADLGGAGSVQSAPLDNPAALRALLEPCATVIACAGPFQLHGEPVVRAAIDTATHYVDTTGEQPFMRLIFERFGTPAEEAGAALVTAMGFDYLPGDMIAGLTAEGMGPLDEIVLAYAVRGFGASRGTTASALGMMDGSDFEYRDGALHPASQQVGRGTFDFPSPIGRQRMTRYPAGEHVTVPRHVETRKVRTLLSAATTMPHPRLAPLAAVTMPAVQLALRTPARRLFEAAVARLPEGPSEAARKASRFTIVCDARAGERTRRGVIRGADVYGLTARSTVEAALRMAGPAFDRRGALAPSQAFAPREFLAALADYEVAWEILA